MGVLRSWSYLCWVRIFCYKSVLEVSTKRHGSIMIILFVPNSVSITPWIHDTNWTYTRRSGDVQNIFCTCSVRSVYVFCPGKVRKNFFFWELQFSAYFSRTLGNYCYSYSEPFKRQSYKMAKHTAAICWLFPTNFFECVWPFCGDGA